MRTLVARVRKASRKISERAIARDPGRAECGSVVVVVGGGCAVWMDTAVVEVIGRELGSGDVVAEDKKSR